MMMPDDDYMISFSLDIIGVLGIGVVYNQSCLFLTTTAVKE